MHRRLMPSVCPERAVSDERGEARSHESGAACGFVDGSVMNLLAFATPAGVRTKPDHSDHFAGQLQFDLLNHFGRLFAGHDGSVAIGTFEATKVDKLDRVLSKRGSLVFRMSRLSAAFALAAVLGLGFGLLDNVAGRRLRRIGRVFLGGGQFRLQLHNSNLELVQLLLQNGASCARVRPCNRHNATRYSIADNRASANGP